MRSLCWSTPTRMPSSTSEGARRSPSPTTNCVQVGAAGRREGLLQLEGADGSAAAPVPPAAPCQRPARVQQRRALPIRGMSITYLHASSVGPSILVASLTT